MAKLVLLAFALAICQGQAPQPPAGVVSGQVTSTAGEPVKHATVRLRGLVRGVNAVRNPASNSYSATSDASGNFTFAAVPSGSYSVSAEHLNYLRGADGSDIMLTLDPGGVTAGLSLRLTPEGRMEGVVTDEDGDPLPETRVFALKWTASKGFKGLVSAGDPNQNTAADGTFVLGGLDAGRYYLCADVVRGQAEPRGRSAQDAYLSACYPGVSDAASATSIKVDAGGVIRGIDIRLHRGPVHRFGGKAVNSTTNAPAADLNLNLTLDSRGHSAIRSVATGADGSFDLRGLPPGEYTIDVGYTKPPVPLVARTALFAGSITVGEKDVVDAVLRLIPAVQIDGKVAAEGNQPSQQSRLSVFLSSASGSTPSSRSNPDGSFVLSDLRPAKYLPVITGLAPGMYVKSLRFGNQDATRTFIDLTAGTGGTLEIALAPNAADVSGEIQNSSGKPLPKVEVTLWKPGQRSPEDGMFVPLEANTDPSGGFHFANLAPGDYRIAAWSGVGAIMAPEFLSQFDTAAAAVTLEEGSHQAIHVPVIRQDGIDVAVATLR